MGLREKWVQVVVLDRVFIRKQTAVWLSQDTERISADRFFRVSAKQPLSEKTKEHKKLIISDDKPISAKFVAVGDVCMFRFEETYFKVGTVIHFVKYDKNQRQFPYKGSYADLGEQVG